MKFDFRIKKSAIETPCVDICAIDPETRMCEGCFRTLDEIAAWGSMPPEERRRIMAELPGRRVG